MVFFIILLPLIFHGRYYTSFCCNYTSSAYLLQYNRKPEGLLSLSQSLQLFHTILISVLLVSDFDMNLTKLLLGNLTGGSTHQILGIAVHREGNDFTDIFLIL